MNAYELHQRVNLLPRSYRDVRLDEGKETKPFRNSSLHAYEFKDAPESYLTKIGKMSLKRRKNSFEEREKQKKQEEDDF